mmetsp:Transcript_28381/g.72043  ORF Transcript_28381/g.72043 Transcript_28381/m.72043 type:complete len:278 (-) Transcript_28381:3590-4423(-)
MLQIFAVSASTNTPQALFPMPPRLPSYFFTAAWVSWITGYRSLSFLSSFCNAFNKNARTYSMKSSMGGTWFTRCCSSFHPSSFDRMPGLFVSCFMICVYTSFVSEGSIRALWMMVYASGARRRLSTGWSHIHAQRFLKMFMAASVMPVVGSLVSDPGILYLVHEQAPRGSSGSTFVPSFLYRVFTFCVFMIGAWSQREYRACPTCTVSLFARTNILPNWVAATCFSVAMVRSVSGEEIPHCSAADNKFVHAFSSRVVLFVSCPPSSRVTSFVSWSRT